MTAIPKIDITLKYPDATAQELYGCQYGGIILRSPYPWFAPRPLISYAYAVYQVATVITVCAPEYPSYGTKEERDVWSAEYEAAQKNADALAQIQAPGCEFLEASVLGRTYVWPIERYKSGGLTRTAYQLRDQIQSAMTASGMDDISVSEFVCLNAPLQRVSYETYINMLEALPPFKWNPQGGLIRGHLMSEFNMDRVTSAFFYRPGSQDCCHAYVDGTRPMNEVWAELEARLRQAEFERHEARAYLTAHTTPQATLDLDMSKPDDDAPRAPTTLAQAQNRTAGLGTDPAVPGLYITEEGGSLRGYDRSNFILANEA